VRPKSLFTKTTQMIPSDITYDANATPPQWTDNGEQVIEKGTNIRIKIKGIRSEVEKMYAVGTMKEVCITCERLFYAPH
jgi:DNA-directed RNA polymerase II subunit RPB7